MLLPFIASFIIAASTKSPTDIGWVRYPAVSAPATVNKALILQMVNDLRSKGCKCGDTYYPPALPVVWNSLLEAAASAHANDMYKKNYFSHIGSDGSNGGMRIDKAGYKWVAYGENIAAGYGSELSAIEGWILSPLHCKNMMNKSYKEMGVARAGNYWTQDFASR